jgi:integrase
VDSLGKRNIDSVARRRMPIQGNATLASIGIRAT